MFITRRMPLFMFSTGESSGGGEVQAETPETLANTPQDGTGTTDQQANWEERYKEAQSWGTRNAQEAAGLREKAQLIDDWNSDDPEAQRRAAELLGIQLDEEPPASDLEGQYAQLDPETRRLLEDFKSTTQQQQQSQQEQQQMAQYRADVDPQLKDLGVPDGLHDLVAEAALQLPGVHTPQGLRPDLQGAIAQVEELVLAAADLPSVQKKVMGRYRDTKRAPHISSSGIAGTQAPDLDNRQARIDWMVEQAQAQEQ